MEYGNVCHLRNSKKANLLKILQNKRMNFHIIITHIYNLYILIFELTLYKYNLMFELNIETYTILNIYLNII
jgi:hypothetical protein